MNGKELAIIQVRDSGSGFSDYIAADTALPQEWLNWFVKETQIVYEKVRASTIWVYRQNYFGGVPFSSDTEVQSKIQELYYKDVV